MEDKIHLVFRKFQNFQSPSKEIAVFESGSTVDVIVGWIKTEKALTLITVASKIRFVEDKIHLVLAPKKKIHAEEQIRDIGKTVIFLFCC